MLLPVWRGDARVGNSDVRADLEAARVRAREEIGGLPEELRATGPGDVNRKLVASDGLVREIERLVAEAR
jgi:hypothetical protein